jgi:glycosyltransferase involved in cell wall biosynthesis
MSNPLVSICIPVYYSGPEIPRVLDELLASIETQDYADIEVVTSFQGSWDFEIDSQIEDLVQKYIARGMSINYSIAPIDTDGPAKNTNNALELASGDLIKIMNQDDLFDSNSAISEMVAQLQSSSSHWLINACIHTDGNGSVRERPHLPSWPGEKGMVEGVNRFGCPSVVMFESDYKPLCDPELILCMDCDMWIQMHRKMGMPAMRNTPDVVIRMWDDQLSNQLDYPKSLETDKVYMRNKYDYQ